MAWYAVAKPKEGVNKPITQNMNELSGLHGKLVSLRSLHNRPNRGIGLKSFQNSSTWLMISYFDDYAPTLLPRETAFAEESIQPINTALMEANLTKTRNNFVNRSIVILHKSIYESRRRHSVNRPPVRDFLKSVTPREVRRHMKFIWENGMPGAPAPGSVNQSQRFS